MQELAAVHGHFNDALDVVLADHAEVAPENLAILIQQDGSTHFHGTLRDENLEHALVICKHRRWDAVGHLLLLARRTCLRLLALLIG